MTSIVEMVRHYQRSIEKSLENPIRLMHCIQKLNKLPITVEHLQETGVGRTVNNLRKYEGEVGIASKALVTKWKTMVATEEAENDSGGEQDQEGGMDTQENCQENDENDEDQIPDEDDEENQLRIDETENFVESSEELQEQRKNDEPVMKDHTNENHHKKSSKHSSDKKHKHHSDHKSEKKHSHKDRHRHASSGTQDDESSHRKNKSSHKERKEEKKAKSSNSETKSHKHHSCSSNSKEIEDSSHKSDSHSSKKSKKVESSDTSPKENGDDESRVKRHEKKSSKSHESKKSSSKKDESGKKRKRDTSDIIIDSTMGASFADALGMLDMPSSSKSKSKHLSESVRPSTSTTHAPSTSSSPNNHTKKPSSSSSNVVNTKKLMEEPELLTKRPKLEPLPDIAAEIQPVSTPIISNNYKPMPLNQTVMDCVFSQSSKPMRQMTDEEALTYSISSNKTRTKVYSGVKSGTKGKVDSLFDLCIHVLQDNIDYLEYTGGVPFDILRPVLERATVDQLMILEDYNPYLIEDSDCLWEQHCRRRFRGKRPEELESWREMFLRCLDEEKAKFENLTQNIKLAREKSLPVRKTKLAYVDSVVKPPRGIKSKQVKYGTDTLPNVTPAARVEALKNIGGNSASIGDRRLKIAAELRNSIPTHGPRINPNKKAPLMMKTLNSMKKVFKR